MFYGEDTIDQIRNGDIVPATYQECEEVLEFLIKEWSMDGPEQFAGAYIGVIPKYMTDGPGFIGKVYVIVWAGSPGFVTTVTKSQTGEWKLAANAGD